MEEIKKINLKQEPEIKVEKRRKMLGKKLFLFPVILVALMVIGIAIPGFMVATSAQSAITEAKKLKDTAKTKDLKLIATQITATKSALKRLDNSLQPFAWTRVIPFVGSYQEDAVHMVRAGEAGLEAGEIGVTAIAPYADLLGFTGAGQAQDGQKTAEDRISLLVTTLDKVSPELDKIGEKAAIAQKELNQVDPNRYPESFRGQAVRGPLTQLITLVDEGATLTNDARPLLKQSSWLLGNEKPRKYLVLFQNDGELRPTGGFVTAFALLEISKGKVKPLLSEDIYAIDAKYKPTKDAPEALVKYVPIPYKQDPRWRLRDMNISPDFSVAMQTFSPEFEKVSGLDYDGIIAVDTEVLIRLLRVLGPVGVAGLGNFSAEPDKRCDGCPQVVYELERLITKPLNRIVTERKAVLGPLMHSLLSNAFGSPKEKLPDLFEAGFTSMVEKHVLFYFPDENLQQASEAFGIAGRIKDYDGDYFHLNDSNFAGAKVNMFLKQQVDQKVEISRDGTVVKTVTVTYKNPSPGSDCNLERGGLCLNAPYRDWVRLYVPKGAKILDSTGLEGEIITYDELGKTVFEGFFGDKYPLRPEGQAKISFKYQLPFKVEKGDYRLLIQKQPGTTEHLYSLEINGKIEEFELKTDKEFKHRI